MVVFRQIRCAAIASCLRFALVVLLSPTTLHAEWSALGTSDLDAIYIDYSSVHRNGNIVRVLMLRDAAEEHSTAQGQHFFSRKLYFELDCASSQYRVKSTMVHAGHMGTGDTIESIGESDAMQPIPAGTIADGIQQAVCH